MGIEFNAIIFGIADNYRLLVLQGAEHQIAQLVAVPGRAQHHTRDGAQDRHIENSVVGRAVGTHQPTTVQAEYYRQVLQGNIMQDLIKRPLQECRINSHDRTPTLCGQAAGKGYCVLLGQPHIVVALREQLGILSQPGAHLHGRGDAADGVVGPGQLDGYLAENLIEIGGRGSCGGTFPAAGHAIILL